MTAGVKSSSAPFTPRDYASRPLAFRRASRPAPLTPWEEIRAAPPRRRQPSRTDRSQPKSVLPRRDPHVTSRLAPPSSFGPSIRASQRLRRRRHAVRARGKRCRQPRRSRPECAPVAKRPRTRPCPSSPWRARRKACRSGSSSPERRLRGTAPRRGSSVHPRRRSGLSALFDPATIVHLGRDGRAEEKVGLEAGALGAVRMRGRNRDAADGKRLAGDP